MNYLPVLDAYRSGYIDSRFFALVFLYDNNGLKLKIGEDNGDKFFLRSMFKPIQASILENAAQFTYEELAVMQASHTGSPVHTGYVASILKKIGIDESFLKCPVIPPLDLSLDEKMYTPLHNNCSGKHAMMLACCVQNGFGLLNYTNFEHPVQQIILEKLLHYAKTQDYIAAKDGCTAPVYGLSIDATARAFINYYADCANARLIGAYRKNPYLIGGANRTDTKIMQLAPNLVSKTGAGGFIYIYNFETGEILIIKMSQDNNAAREIIALEILFRIKWLKKREYDDKIYTENNEPVGFYKLNADI